jgi:hypothetical protein
VLTRRMSLAPVTVVTRPPKARPKRRRHLVDHDEYLAMMARIARAAGPRVGKADPAQLRLLIGVAADIDRTIVYAVAGLRACGFKWQTIADELGVTRQAAQQRWGRRVEELNGASSTEGRAMP